MLNVVMVPTSYLPQGGYTGFEMLKTDTRLQYGELEVEFFAPNSMDALLCVMVPELFVPMVEGFRSEELTGFGNCAIQESPVLPEWKVNTIQSETLLSFLCIGLKVPRINIFREAFNLSKGESPEIVSK